MKKRLITLTIVLAGCGSTTAPPQKLTQHCRALSMVRPDPRCTPGAVDPHVTQANIGSTICKRGYTATVRPPVSYTNRLKKLGIEQYGYPDHNLRDYEEDHLVSLELGGAPSDSRNLWPQLGASPNPKDKVENRLRVEVCGDKLSLKAAQQEIATNWTTAR